ncbi:MAG: TRAP transporter small permease [Clostridiales Family XIII bacterium]|jgi:TRAP-type C4-dicarboxylate transport system permease small subunit|nr:TRAP transporter small permease [Clostridiales Family XIII bacterium]
MDEKLEKRLKLATKFFRVFAEISMWLMFIDAVLIIVNIITRRFFNFPILGTTEMVRYLMLGCASFAIIENEWVDGNVSMLVFLEKLKEKTFKIVLGVVYAVTTIGTAIIAYLLIIQAALRFEDGQSSNELHFPLWIPATFIAIGFCVLVITLLLKTILYFWMGKTGNTLNFRKFGEVQY